MNIANYPPKKASLIEHYLLFAEMFWGTISAISSLVIGFIVFQAD